LPGSMDGAGAGGAAVSRPHSSASQSNGDI
jgi:hypothetical protein